jgi:hypothetical protein
MGVAGSAKTLVVIGDSHARMWMPAVLRLAQLDGWTVVPFVKPRCVPRDWYRASSECRPWLAWATAHAVAQHPYVTLLIGSWSGTANPGAAVQPVARLAARMRKSSAAVIVLGDAPTQARDPVDCLLAAGATMKTCTAKARNVQLRTDDRVAADARKSRTGFISTRGWFCARGANALLCPLVINKTIAWADRGHISQTYALELAGPFRAAFRHALFASP